MSARLLVLFALCLYAVYAKQCYWNSAPCLYYGSKTLYEDVRGDIRSSATLKGCSPVSIWILARHGARNPGPHNIANMKDAIKLQDVIIKSHSARQGEMCDQDIENLKKWKWNSTIDDTAYHLIARGYDELYGIGYRVREKFLSLIENLDDSYIRPTNEQRTKESAKAFVRGLEKAFNISDPLETDVVLTPYSICPLHRKEVWFGDQSDNEVNRYYMTEEFIQDAVLGLGGQPLLQYGLAQPKGGEDEVLQNLDYLREINYDTNALMQVLIGDLQRRTGLSEPISATNITGLYDLCRFFRGYSDDNRSPWCALFTHQDLTALDYTSDVKHYFRNGFGHPVNPKLGEFALKDLHEFFENAVNNSTKNIKAYFSHDSLLEMVYSALGLFQDYPGISGSERLVPRRWHTSLNTPFAANIISVLHRCPAAVDTTHKVQFFINEKEVQLCNDSQCSWEEFDKKFRPFLNATLAVCNNR